METICIMCPVGCALRVRKEDGKIFVEGNACVRGRKYGETEFNAPMRTVTTLMRTESGGVLSCKSQKPVPKEKIFDVTAAVKCARCGDSAKIGDILIRNAADTGVDIVATSNGKGV